MRMELKDLRVYRSIGGECIRMDSLMRTLWGVAVVVELGLDIVIQLR